MQGSSEGEAEMSNSRFCPKGLTFHRGVDKRHVPNELLNRIARCLPYTGLCNVRERQFTVIRERTMGMQVGID